MQEYNGKQRRDYTLDVGLGRQGVRVSLSVYSADGRDGESVADLSTNPDDALNAAEVVKQSRSFDISR